MPAGEFVPNETALGPDGGMILVITGPNMAGKSTYIRQVALLSVLAQMGSFVPAKRARLGIVDRLFARVGATDELSRGQSTFMVEMTETANILNNATPQSLVILDEIGRGTSTFDGISLAWAITEHLHDHVGCRTLFATHYHELVDLEKTKPRLRNANVAVRESGGEIVFLHRIVPGGADQSYGIHVARLAGVPAPVLDRAREILAFLEKQHGPDPGAGRGPGAEGQDGPGLQNSLFAALPEPLLDELRKADLAAMTPEAAVWTCPAAQGLWRTCSGALDDPRSSASAGNPDMSETHDPPDPDRLQRLELSRLGGPVLPRGDRPGRLPGVVRRPVPDRRGRQLVLPAADRQRWSADLVSPDAERLPVRAEGAAGHHPQETAPRLPPRRSTGSSRRSCRWARSSAAPCSRWAISTAGRSGRSTSSCRSSTTSSPPGRTRRCRWPSRSATRGGSSRR